MSDPLAAALLEHAYLEGDFLLRSGRRSRYYLDKYRFETRPELLRPLGERIAATVREHAPDAVRLAAPELGAVALAAAASLDSGLPFLIVRKEANIHEADEERTTVLLLDGQGMVIAASRADLVYTRFALSPPQKAPRGSYYMSDGTLVAYAETLGYEDYSGLGWSGVVIQRQEKDEDIKRRLAL